jgi:hypothetical protein
VRLAPAGGPGAAGRVARLGGGGAGGKIAVILAGQTLDLTVGNGASDAIRDVAALFEEEVQKKHVRSVVKVVGEDYSRDKILKAVAEADVGPNDALVLYIIGHGSHDPKLGAYANGHYFEAPGKILTRKELRDALVDKRARLTCLISDSCNEYWPAPHEQTFMERRIREENVKFNSLFLKPHGVVDLNSARTGESAFVGVFTPVFVNSLTEYTVRAVVAGPGKKDRQSLPRRIGPDDETTWPKYADELTAGTNARFELFRDEALRNKLRGVERQLAQTVQAYTLPDAPAPGGR